MCSELTGPDGETGVIQLTVMDPTVDVAAGAAVVVVDDVIRPVVDIKVDGKPMTRGRFAVRSLKTGIVQIDSGTKVTVIDRGIDTLIVSLIGTTISPELSSKYADTIPIIARADTNLIVVGPNKATITAIGDTTMLKAVSKGSKGTLIKNGSVVWTSSDPATITVDSVPSLGRPDSNFAVVTALRPGTATISALFEGVITQTQTITVQQTIAKYGFERAAVPGVPVTSLNLSSKGDTVTLRAIARDRNNNDVQGTVPAPIWTLAAGATSEVTVDANTGLVTAVSNTNPDARIKVNNANGTFPNDSVIVVVKQIADSIRIQGARTVNLSAIGDAVSLTADVFDARRQSMGNNGNLWSKSNATVAAIDDETKGDVRAIGVGSTQITVTRDGKSDAITLNVSNDPKTVTVAPDTMKLKSLTETGQATMKFFNSRNVELTNLDATSAQWATLDPSIATVDAATGVVTAVAVGTARIVGTPKVGAGADTIPVIVTDNPATVSFGVTSVTIGSIGETLTPPVPVDFKNAKGVSLPRSAVTWDSKDKSIAVVTLDGLGGITAVGKGQTEVTATSADGATASVGVIVTNAPETVTADRDTVNFTSIALTAGSGTLGVSSVQLSAVARNGKGALITGAQLAADPITWRSLDGSVASVDLSTGLVTALGNGTAKIIAEIGSSTALRADTVVINVTNAAANMTLSGSNAITSVGGTTQLTATATNNAGGVISGQTFTWSSNAIGIATVSNTGLVTAQAIGQAVITASIPTANLSRTLTITVTNLPDTIRILTPDTTLASINDTFAPLVDFKNAAGQVLGIGAASWSSDDPSIVSVNSSGLIKAVSAGTTTIRATNSTNPAITDDIVVTVTNAPFSMVLNPATTQTLTSLGQTLTITATVKNKAGNVISSPTVTWSSSTPGVATAADAGIATGLVTAVANGSTTIHAIAGTVDVPLTVNVGQLVSSSQSTVIADSATMVADGNRRSTIHIQLKDANGNPFANTQPTVTLTRSLGTLMGVTSHGNGSYSDTLIAGTSIGGAVVSATAGTVGISNSALISLVSAPATKYVVTSNNFAPAAGSQVTMSAQLADANNNPVTTSGITVTWTSTGGGCFGSGPCIQGKTSATNGAGIATITFTTNNAAATHVVTATDGSLSGSSAQIVGTAANADHYVVTSTTLTPAAGAAVTLTAQLVDVNGNNVATKDNSVAWTIGGTPIAGSPTLTDATGKATISYTTSTTAGTVVTIDAATGGASGSVVGITTVPGPAAKILISGTGTQQPSGTATASVAFGTQPIVRIADANNNTVTSDNTTIVTVARGSGTGTLQGTLSRTASSGIVSWVGQGLNHPTASTIDLVFSSGSLATATSSSITVSASVTTSAAQTTASVPAGTAGAVTSIIVQARDANGNNRTTGGDVVAATVSGANSASLSIGSGITDLNDGTGRYQIQYTPTNVGTDAITITFGASPVAISGSPYSSVVGSGALDHFQVAAQGGGAIGTQSAGSAFNVRVVAQDASNNTVTSFTGTVNLTSSGTLTGTPVTTGSFINGVFASQAVTITSTGSTTITASGGGKNGTSNSFTVNPAVATHLTILTQPDASPTSGSVFSPQPAVQIRDASNNVVTTDNTTIVTATAIGGTGSLLGTTTATATNGVATFSNLRYDVAETIQIRFTTTSPVLTQATSNNVVVAIAGASQLSVTQSPTASPQSGIAFPTQPTIQLRDAAGNAVSSSGINVTAAITAGGGTLGGTTTVATNGSGVAVFTDLAITGTAGARTLTFSSGGLTSTTASVTLTAGNSDQLSVATAPTASPQNDIAFPTQPAIQIKDANGNNVSAGGVTITAAITAGGGTLGGTLTAITNSNGLATFTNLKVTGTVGTRTLTFSAGGVTSTTADVTLIAGTANQLAITTQPSAGPTAGVAFATQPVVEIRDVSGNRLLTDNTTLVTASRFAGSGTLQGTLTATAVGGIATFTNLQHNVATTITIAFASSGLTGATSNNVVVGPGAAAALAIQTQPGTTSAVAGAAFSPQPAIQILDAFGNLRSGDNSTVVTASRLAGSGTLTGTITATAAGGVATFTNLGHDVVGSITVQFTSGGLTPVTSNAISVTASGAAALTVTTAPSANPQSGIAIPTQPVIQLRDGQGNPSLTAGTNVTATITSGAGTLSGTTTVATDASGVATFTNLVITGAVGARTITFSASGVTSTSASVSVVAGTLANFLVERSGGGAITTQTAGTSFNIQVTARDGAGNTVTAFDGGSNTVNITSTGTLSAGSGATAAFVNGVLSSHAVTISNTGSFTITATKPTTLEAGTSTAFTVNPGTATHLFIATQPSATATSGSPFAQQPVVRIRDANNNIVTTDNTTIVTATAIGGTGSLLGTTTATAVSGVATFTSLRYDLDETIQVRFTTTSPVLTQATSTNVDVDANSATKLAVIQSPTASPQNDVVFPTQPTVQLKDAAGNNVASSGIDVQVAITSGGGTLVGTTTVQTDAGGLATFTNLKIQGAAGSRTLTFGSPTVVGGTLTTTTATVTLTAGTATQLAVIQAPTSSPQNDIVFPAQPTVQLKDANGNNVASSGIDVEVTMTGAGTLGGTTVVQTDANGLATFTNLKITGTIGARTLNFGSPTVAGSTLTTTTAGVTLVAGTATQLVVTTQPSATATAGVALAQQPVVAIRDVSGNTVLIDNTTLVTASRSAGSGTLQGTLTATAVNGVATFTNLQHNVATTISIGFAASGVTGATSNTIAVDPGAAASLGIVTQPGTTSAVAGAAFNPQPAIEILDAFGNRRTNDGSTVVTASRLAGTGTLTGTITATASGGVATFTNLGHNVAGSITVQFTSGALTPVTSNAITVTAGSDASLTVTTAPSANPQSGIAFPVQPVIQLRDAQGNPSTSSGVTVTAAITSGAGTLGGTLTANTDASGVATFTNLSITGAIGARTITFSASGVTSATASVTVVAGTLANFLVEQSGGGAIGTQTAGTSFNIRITARDGAGNTVTGFSGAGNTVDITSTGTLSAGSGATATFTNGILSAHAVTISNTGNFTITATKATTLETGVSNSITVNPGVATHLAISQQPSGTATSGSAFAQQPIIQILDANNNIVTTDNTTIVTATAIGGTGSLLGTTTATATAGVATFSTLRYDLDETIQVRFTTTSPVLTQATSNNVDVDPGAAAKLTLTTAPSASPRSGEAFAQQPVLQLRDAANNAVSSNGVSVEVAITSGAGTLSGTATVTTNASGVATFTDLVITGTAGARTLTFASPSIASPTISSATASVTLVAGDANQLSVATAPTASPQNDIAFPTQPAIQLKDPDGNNVSQSGVVVTAAITAGGGTLGGTLTATTNASGLATFTNLKITGTIGTRTLTFTAPSVSSTTADVTTVAGTATQLVITTQPSGTATAGATFAQQPVIAIRDVSGNTVLTDNTTLVTVSRSAGSGTLQGTLTATAVNGVATFTNLQHNVATTISVAFAASGLTGATSNNVVVDPGAAAALALLTQPSGAVAGAAFTTQPAIQVLDAFGNLRTNDGSTVVTAARLAGTGTLAGTITATASSGVATFSDLQHDVVGTITIQFTSGGLTPVTSAALAVTSGAASQLTVTTAPSANPQSGIAFPVQPAIQLRDAQGNPKLTAGVTVTAAITSGAGTLGGTLTANTNASGVATFTDLAITGATGARTITFSSGGVTSATASVTVVAGTLANFLVERSGGGAITTQTAGSAFNIQLTARDGAGNTVTGFGGTVELTSTGALSGTPVTTGSFTNGVLASQAVTITNTGNFTITATKPTTLETGTSAAFTVNPGIATHLSISQQPSASATSGSAFAQQPIVQILDANNNVVTTDNTTIVTATAIGGTGSLLGTTTATATAGVATFSTLRYDLDETIQVRFTTTSPVLTQATSNNVDVDPGAAAKLTLTTAPSASPRSGEAFAQQPVLQLRDAANNAVSTNGVSVEVAITSGAGTLSGTTTVTTNASGVATFTDLVITGTAGARTLTFASPSIASPTITSVTASVTLVAGDANQLSVATAPTASPQNDIAFPTQPAIQLKDADGNNAPESGVVVTAAITAGGGTLSGTLTATTDANGLATFTNLKITGTIGTRTLTFTAPSVSSTTADVTTVAGTATQLGISTQPSTGATVGTAFAQQPVVQIQDVSGNVVTTNNTTVVTATRSGGSGTLQGTTAVTAQSGVATFTNLSHNTASSITIQFTASGLTAATSNSITVTGGTKYLVTAASSPVNAAGVVLVAAQLADASNNPVAQAGKTVIWSKTCDAGACAGDATGGSFATPSSITDASGQAVIALTVSSVAGVTHTVTATDNTALTGTSAGIVTQAGPLAKVQLLVPGETAAPGTTTGKTGTPTARTAGSSFSVTVNGVDANWNVVTSASDNIQITSSDPDATLPANNTLSSGTQTFSVTLNTAGSFTITATDLTNGAITANTSPSITVNAGAYTQLQVLLPGETADPGSATGKTGSPTAQTAGTGFTATVNAVDSRFNLVNTITESVAVTTSDANDTHPGAQALVGGTKNFTVTFTTAGSWTVTATGSPSTNTGTSASVSVGAGAFTKLQLLVPGETAAPGTASGKTGSPTARTAGSAFSVTVNAVDANWNVVSTAPADNIQITTTDANDTEPANNTLSSGTQTFNVTFVTADPTGWTITATDLTDGAKTANTSPSIAVNAGAFTKLQLLVPGETAAPGTGSGKSGSPSAQTADQAFSVTVNAVDANWNVVATAPADNIQITSSDVNATLPANNTLSSGTRTFSVKLNTANGTGWTVTATDASDGAKTANTSPNIVVNAGAYSQLQVLVPGETAAPGSATGKTGSPSTQTAGSGFTATVNAVDSRFNPVSSTESVSITTTDANDTEPGAQALVGGTKDFTVTFVTADPTGWTITATGAPSTNTGTSAPVPVTAGAFTKLQLLVPGETAAPGTGSGKSGSPSAQTADQSFNVTVNAVDANWNVVSTAPADNIQITSSDANATLPANNTLSSGTRTFSVKLNTADGTGWTVTATDLTDGAKTANTSPNIVVNAGAYSQLQVLVPGEVANPGSATGKTGASPTAQTAGVLFTVTVNAVDSRFNLVTSVTNNVLVTTSDANDTDPSAAALVGGTKNFDVTMVTAAVQTVTADDQDNGAIPNGVSANVTVGAGVYDHILILVPNETYAPGTATGKTGTVASQTTATPFSVTFKAVDFYNNTRLSEGEDITISSTDAGFTPVTATFASGTVTVNNATFTTTDNLTGHTISAIGDTSAKTGTSSNILVPALSALQLLNPVIGQFR